MVALAGWLVLSMQERLAAEKARRSAAEAELKALKVQLQDQQAASAAEVEKLKVSCDHKPGPQWLRT
jgi:hypothetical protein